MALFSVQHMQRLVMQGRWKDALMYLNTYLPPLTENHKRSRRAQIFHNFLLIHYRFANAVAGNKEKHLDKHYAEGRWCSSHAERRFRAITYPILASEPQQLMDSFDWEKVRGHASFVVYILAETTPELRRAMPLQSSCMMPQLVLPIGSRLHRRRHRVVKKKGPQKPDTDAILMALKSQHHSSLYRESPDDAMEMLVDYLDQTLQAGRRTGCSLIYEPQPSVMEGVSDAPDVQTMAGSSADNAKGHAASSVKFYCAPYFQFISGTS